MEFGSYSQMIWFDQAAKVDLTYHKKDVMNYGFLTTESVFTFDHDEIWGTDQSIWFDRQY